MRVRTLLALLFVPAAVAFRMHVPPTTWPIARLVENLEARCLEAPDDAETHATLGRAHGFAFALDRTTVLGGPGGIWVNDLDIQRDAPPGEPLAPAERLVHLAEGVKHLRRACELQDSAQTRLTLAWLVESGATLAPGVDSPDVLAISAAPVDPELPKTMVELGSEDAARAAAARSALEAPEVLERAVPLFQRALGSPNPRLVEAARALLVRAWTERAIAEYGRALDLAFAETLAEESVRIERGKELKTLAPREAMLSYRRLVEARGIREPERERLERAEVEWKELLAKPRSTWITPIVVALDGCPGLDELVAPDLAVPFDLDGDGVDELWPWLAPHAGWLVWDPEARGEITSGRQLFGSASAWLFFADGYRVLDALDDDRDGALRERELDGIAVWFDRDLDGVSDRGEVMPLAELGIVALATEPTERIGRSLGNAAGLELADGRVLPTYDWVVRRAAP